VDVFVEDLFMFRFKAKENLQRCGDVFFDILISRKGASALDVFQYICSAGNNFSSLTGHVSFQIFILVGHLINLTGH